MGLFDRFSNGMKLMKIGRAFTSALGLLDNYQQTSDIDFLHLAAWIFREGIFTPIEELGCAPTTPIYFMASGQRVNMTIDKATSLTYQRLMSYAENLSEDDQAVLEDILEGGEIFDEINAKMTDDVRNRLF